MNIRKRPISTSLTATGLVGSQASVVQGTPVELTLDLIDESRNQTLVGATVVLNLDNGGIFSFTEKGNGRYVLSFPTDDITALFTAQTLTGSISISKNDFISKSVPLTIVVNMTEIFPGVPLFYFIMIVAAVVAIIGYAVISRSIRNARIPTFIKKIRNVKSAIHSRKSISDNDIYPPVESAMVKKLGNRWEMLGLNLSDILGVGITKGKPMPENTSASIKEGGRTE